MPLKSRPPEMDEETNSLESATERQHRHQGPMRTADDHHTRNKKDNNFKNGFH